MRFCGGLGADAGQGFTLPLTRGRNLADNLPPLQRLLDQTREMLPFTDPVVVFAVVLAIILLAPLVMRRLRIPAPGMIGLILAGAIVGEHALNILERDRTVGLLGTVGLLYLMFTAGLSMDLGQFQRTRGRSIGFGLMSFLIPQMMGIAAGLYLLNFTPLQAVLLGSIVGSHTLLAYPIAKRLGITRNRAVTMTLGGTIVTDVLALSVLAGVAAAAVPDNDIGLMFWAQFIGLVALFVIAVVFGLPVLGRLFFRTVRDRTELDFVFLLVVLFAAAAIAGWVGLAPIVGAFLAGLTMNRLVPDTGPLMNRVHFVGEALLIPFFLLSVGMLVDFRVLAVSADVWIYAITFTALVVIGKGGSAKLGQHFFGLRPDEGWTMAGLTIPQAAATLAVTLVGFQLDIFDHTVVNAIVILILASCLLGPWLVEHFGRSVALAEERAPAAGAADGSPQRILVPLANPATADALMDLAFMLRTPGSLEPIYPLMVARDGPPAEVEAQVAAGEKLLSHAVVHAAAAGVPVLPVTLVDFNVAHGVERAVRERRISTLIIGWNGQVTSWQAILGSILDQLLNSTQQTMLIARIAPPPEGPPLNTTRRIIALVPRFAEREPGFGESMRMVKMITKEIGASDLVIATPQVAILRITDIAEKSPPQVDIVPLPLPPERGMLNAIEPEVIADDLIILISCRPGRLSWTGELGRMPHVLSKQFPQNNVLILYMPEVEEPLALRSEREFSAPLLSPQRVNLALPSAEFGEAIHALMKPYFADRLHILNTIHSELMTRLDQFAMEVSPGIVLLHRHVERIRSPIVFIGIRAGGLTVPGLTSSAKAIVLLLSPTDLPPEEHLRVLAQIAQMLSRERVLDRLAKADSPAEVMEILQPETVS